MTDVLTFVVAGLTIGSTLALVAVGIVLTYRTSGILNFAQGALAIVAVDAYQYFTVNRGWSWEVGAALAVFGVGAVMGLMLEPLGRVLLRATPALQVVATIGLLIAIEAASILIGPHIPGHNPHFVVPPMPATTVKIAGVYVGKDQMIIMAVALVSALGLWAFLRRARIGFAMRAVVTNPDLLELSGTRAVVARRWAWVIASMFAALSGVLLALSPTFGPSPGTVDLVIIPAFAAAAIAMFTSLPLAYVGGLVVGVVSSLLTKYTLSASRWVLGLPAASPYIILLVVLLLTPRRRLEPSGDIATKRAARDPRLPRPVNVGLGVVVIALIALTPTWAGFGLAVYTTALIYVVLFLSLGVLLKTGGLVSLCQIAFVAIGATAFGDFTSKLGVPWFLAAALAVAAAALVGALVALTAIRLSGVFLALATLAFGNIMAQLFYSSPLMFGNSAGSLTAPRPSFAQSDETYYFLVAAFVVLCVVVVYALDRTRLGRLLRGMSDSSVALQVQGTSIQVTKLVVFAVSAGMAGLAGVLLAGANNYVSPSNFPAATSLTLVAVVFVVRLDHPWYAFVAAALYYFIPAKVDVSQLSTWIQLGFGVLAIVTVILSVTARRRRRTSSAAAPAPPPTVAVPVGALVPVAHVAEAGRGLEVRDVTVRFGGLVALDRVSLAAPTGAITGLIGPNGAGKTTLFNACSGFVHPTSGHVLLDGDDVSHRGVSARARRGLGRTFQRPDLFDSLTVREAVSLGMEAGEAGINPLHHVFGSADRAGTDGRVVDEAIELSGVGEFEDAVVGELSAAQRRLVELARCLSGPFEMLLLDEPTAGLDREESRRFAGTLRQIVEARGVGVLVVEHDMSVVMDVCQRVTVLDFGVELFEGTPAEVLASEAVRAAYLGDTQATGSPA